MALKVQASRFALLKVEDGIDSDEQDVSDEERPTKTNQKPVAGAKKNKQKKKFDGDSRNSKTVISPYKFDCLSLPVITYNVRCVLF